jgi:hypothetical protein
MPALGGITPLRGGHWRQNSSTSTGDLAMSEKIKDELLDDLWAGRAQALGREDKIEAQIEKAVATLEAICRPVLETTAA